VIVFEPAASAAALSIWTDEATLPAIASVDLAADVAWNVARVLGGELVGLRARLVGLAELPLLLARDQELERLFEDRLEIAVGMAIAE
jgi:hypothetical protein